MSNCPAAMLAGTATAIMEARCTSGAGTGEPTTLDEMDFVLFGWVALALDLVEGLPPYSRGEYDGSGRFALG